MKKFSGKRQF